MPNSPIADRDRLQPVGHREAAIEDAQRRGADRARLGELEQRAVEAELAGDPAQRCADGVDLGAGAQPERDVGAAQVAGQALVVGAGEHDGAVLARVVAPDAAHVDRRARAVGQRQDQLRARRGAVQVDDRLADIGGGPAWRQRHERTDQRQPRRRVVERARDQRDSRLRRVELQLRDALRLDPRHAG